MLLDLDKTEAAFPEKEVFSFSLGFSFIQGLGLVSGLGLVQGLVWIQLGPRFPEKKVSDLWFRV
jgi:hypothetical protein